MKKLLFHSNRKNNSYFISDIKNDHGFFNIYFFFRLMYQNVFRNNTNSSIIGIISIMHR